MENKPKLYFMHNTILVPVDFSKPSENALKIAASLAKTNQSHLIILHLMEIDNPGIGNYQIDSEKMQELMRISREKFAVLLDKSHLQNVKVTDLIQMGNAHESVNSTVEKYAVNLIIAANEGEHKNHFEVTTKKIIENASVPVLVIKNETNEVRLRKVMLATNFSSKNLNAYYKVKALTNAFNAELRLAYVNTPDEGFRSSNEIWELAQKFLENTKDPFNSEKLIIHNDYSIEKGILNAAHSFGADAVVVPMYQKTGFIHFFSADVAKDVTSTADMPVITFKVANATET